MTDISDAERLAHVLMDERGAYFSECRRYRYLLWRTWDEAKGNVLFIMLNPSTADEAKNDPTVERCYRRAVQWGYGGLVVANIFALRSTDPDLLYSENLPIQEVNKPFHNDTIITVAAKAAKLVVCGWGEHGAHLSRGNEVLNRLRAVCTPHALRINASGQPGHPLYIPYSAQPFEVPNA